MNNFFENLLVVLGAFITNVTLLCAENGLNAKRFVVVSNKEVAKKLYPLPRSIRSDQDTDLATKKQICDDILGTHKYTPFSRYSYEKESVTCFQKLFLKEKKNYTTRLIPSVVVDERVLDVDETVFVCLARFDHMPCKTVFEYYVSSEYRLCTKSDDPNAGYVGVRFVFELMTFTGGTIRLENIAETPAVVYQLSPPFLDIEHVYLDRRENFMPAFNRKLDSLCHLELKEKLRICKAVFTSTYFDGKVEYPIREMYAVEGTCERKVVHFRTDSANDEANAKKRKYEEWMMSCRPKLLVSGQMLNLEYLLSTAYVDNEIWVYYRHPDTNQVFVEILATYVRISVDEQSFRTREHSKTDLHYKYDANESEYSYLYMNS